MAPANEPEYAAVTRWVKDFGIVEIGYDPNTDTFVRAIDEGGIVWSGKRRYRSLSDALKELEAGLGPVLKERREIDSRNSQEAPPEAFRAKESPGETTKGSA